MNRANLLTCPYCIDGTVPTDLTTLCGLACCYEEPMGVRALFAERERDGEPVTCPRCDSALETEWAIRGSARGYAPRWGSRGEVEVNEDGPDDLDRIDDVELDRIVCTQKACRASWLDERSLLGEIRNPKPVAVAS